MVRGIARRRIEHLSTFRRETVPPAPTANGSNPRPSRNGASIAGSDRAAPPLQPSAASG
jgi:hypothetical protein